jgi:hypothetical protein
LRDANLIVLTGNPQNIVLVDYDWGGKHGEALFPTRLLHDELTAGKELESLEITMEHDNRVLKETFQNLRLTSSLRGEVGDVAR